MPTRLKLGQKACSDAAIQAWNRLPTELKTQDTQDIGNTPLFERDLKTFLFPFNFKTLF